MKCPYCNVEQDDGVFCTGCGAKIDGEQARMSPVDPFAAPNTSVPPSQAPYGNPSPSQPNPYGNPYASNPYGQTPPQQGNPYGQTPPQNYNPYGTPQSDYNNPEIKTAKSRASSALVCGIIGIFIAGFILGIIAIQMGVSSRRVLKQYNQPTGTATAGLVLGIVALVGWVFAMIYLMS